MGTAPNGYNTPKTNWTAGNVPTASDFNRIEMNIKAVEEGQRTIDPAQVPASNQGSLRQFLDWFANRIRAITGKANWYDAPSKTLEDLNTHINAAAPHSGHETPAGAQAKVNTHASSKQTHGISGSYYIAKTSRSDQLPAWDDIQSKPSSFAPSKHASTHKTGGTDVITPADIGAAPVSHTHSGADITSAVAFANDADKLDGYQAADFALAKLNPSIIRLKRSNPDAYGNYLQVDYYRKNGTLFARSVLSGGTPPQYTTRTITIYDTDGTTVVDSYTFTITYDANGNPVDEW